MSRVSKAIGPAILAFITYIIFSGSVSTYDLVTGVLVSVVVGTLVANLTVKNPVKMAQVWRLGWLIIYAIRYFLVDEVKAHLDVIYRILSPSMPIKPGIVKVPYEVETDYAMTTVANSITNTPGTVVVDVDPECKCYFVHWINVRTTVPEESRRHISEVFEKYAKKVFD